VIAVARDVVAAAVALLFETKFSFMRRALAPFRRWRRAPRRKKLLGYGQFSMELALTWSRRNWFNPRTWVIEAGAGSTSDDDDRVRKEQFDRSNVAGTDRRWFEIRSADSGLDAS
jgi:hypothetical protein